MTKWLLGLVFMIGLLIMLVALLSDPLIRHMGNGEIETMNTKKVEASKHKKANFDYASVKMLNPANVTWEQCKMQREMQSAVPTNRGKTVMQITHQWANWRFQMWRCVYQLEKDWGMWFFPEVQEP